MFSQGPRCCGPPQKVGRRPSPQCSLQVSKAETWITPNLETGHPKLKGVEGPNSSPKDRQRSSGV